MDVVRIVIQEFHAFYNTHYNLSVNSSVPGANIEDQGSIKGTWNGEHAEK